MEENPDMKKNVRAFIHKEIFIGPPAEQKGHIKWGLSILPSFRPSVLFLGIGSFVFSETKHGGRGLCGIVCVIWNFGKRNFCPKNGENGRKIGFFEFIEKFSD